MNVENIFPGLPFFFYTKEKWPFFYPEEKMTRVIPAPFRDFHFPRALRTLPHFIDFFHFPCTIPFRPNNKGSAAMLQNTGPTDQSAIVASFLATSREELRSTYVPPPTLAQRVVSDIANLQKEHKQAS